VYAGEETQALNLLYAAAAIEAETEEGICAIMLQMIVGVTHIGGDGCGKCRTGLRHIT
jgi:hypothetical protein